MRFYLSHLNTKKKQTPPKNHLCYTISKQSLQKHNVKIYSEFNVWFLEHLAEQIKIQNIICNINTKQKTLPIDYSNIIIQHQNNLVELIQTSKENLLHNITQKQSYNVSNLKIEHKQT